MAAGALAAVNLATGIIKGIVGQQAHKKYAKTLEGLEMEMPSAINQADYLLGDMAGVGLRGKETIEDDIFSSGAASLTEGKKAASSPAALMDLISKVDTNRSNQFRQLGIADANKADQNTSIYSTFLSRVKAPAQQRIQQFDIDKTLAIAREKMQGTKELMEGISGGVGSGLSMLGLGAENKAAKDTGAGLDGFWDSLGGGNTESYGGSFGGNAGFGGGFLSRNLPELNF